VNVSNAILHVSYTDWYANFIAIECNYNPFEFYPWRKT